MNHYNILNKAKSKIDDSTLFLSIKKTKTEKK